MDAAPLEHGRKAHFRVEVPRLSMVAALARSGLGQCAGGDLILEIEPPESRADVPPIASPDVVPFPLGAIVFLRLIRSKAYHDAEKVTLHLPRSGFDRLADAHGVQRLDVLPIAAGAAADDDVLAGLEQCLERTLALPAGLSTLFVSQLATAIQSHVAQTYAGQAHANLGVPPRASNGGLAPWQLRRVRALIDAQLTKPIALSDLAGACNLSISHFSRSFVRSTGVSPHRWIMRRRVDLAQAELRAGDAPLADLALRYGFADQSHFTRVFSAATGKTPGRWRAENQGLQAMA